MSNTPQPLRQHLLMWLNHCNIIVTHTDTVYIITSATIRTIFRTTKFSDKKNDRTIYPHRNYPSSVGNSFTLFSLFQRSRIANKRRIELHACPPTERLCIFLHLPSYFLHQLTTCVLFCA